MFTTILPSSLNNPKISFDSYKTQLKLPHFPDMLFGDNLIQFEHSSGFGINLNALDALKHVNDHEDLVKVAMAEKWKEAR